MSPMFTLVTGDDRVAQSDFSPSGYELRYVQDRISERLWCFLRQVVPGVRYLVMDARTREVTR